MEKKKKVVVIGGGTGTFTVLSGLKKHRCDLSAIVSMADEGGSTGILRDELGVLPPGDVRQCLVALSASDKLMRDLMNYRFPSGQLRGHSFGNLLLSALEKMTGSFDAAVEKASDILRLRGKVIPATLDKVRLVAYLKNGKVIRGEHAVNQHDLTRLARIVLEPKARVNPKAASALRGADLIVIGPGGLYSSVIPNLLISGMARVIMRSRAKKIYICNLMTKAGHTDGFTVKEYVKHIELYLGGRVHHVIYNNKQPPDELVRHYARAGERFVEVGARLPKGRYLGADLVSRKFPKRQPGDALTRNLIRHNPDRLAELIVKLL